MNSNTVTDKQAKFIAAIEQELHIDFTGNTKKDAWQFINDNVEAFRHRQKIKQDAKRRGDQETLTQLSELSLVESMNQFNERVIRGDVCLTDDEFIAYRRFVNDYQRDIIDQELENDPYGYYSNPGYGPH